MRIPLRTVLVGAVVFAFPTVITLDLKHAGEDGIEAQNHLQSYIAEMRIQDGIEWRVISGGLTAKEAHTELVAGRERAAEHLDEAAGLGLSSGAAAHITAMSQHYEQAVNEEVRLLSLGQKFEAAEFNQSHVDPAFLPVTKLLEDQAGQMEAAAKKAQKYGDVGMLLTVMLSLLLASVVQSRRRRAAVSSQTKQQGEAHYRTLIHQSSDLVLVVDRAGRATFASPSVERLLGSDDQNRHAAASTPIDAALLDVVAAVDPLDRARLSTALQTAVPGNTSAGEFRLNGRHGTATFEMTVQDLTTDPTVGGLVLTAHDVTERLALQHEMEHRALHDELTGLPNRTLLADRFEQALLGAERSGTSVGLLLLDLDRFKEVNDTFGHHYGDELLRQIGPRLTSVLRGVDTIARLGGDEFAVLLQDVHGVDDATDVATALLTALSIPFHVEAVDLDVEASVGVVISGEHGKDAITLMQHADIAMYVAKRQHLGVFAYDPSVDGHSAMDGQSATKLAMVGDLRRALDRDELVRWYQPNRQPARDRRTRRPRPRRRPRREKLDP